MKALRIAVMGLVLAGAVAPASAQPYGGYRDRDYDYGDRGPRFRDRDDGYRRDRDDDYRRGGYAFDAGEYLRCNPDVRRALRNGQITSAADHYRVFGRREGRRLSC